MRNYRKTTKQDAEKINDEEIFEDSSNANRELFKRSLSEAMDMKIRKIEEENADIEVSPYRRRYKIRMNRLFRERVGGAFIPFPEADNLYERMRSKIIIKLKINEFLDRHKKRKRNKKSKKTRANF